MKGVTIAACSNADGSFNLPLVLIGKSKHPLCLDKDHSKLPVYYLTQKIFVMDRENFTEWFVDEFVPKVEAFLESKNLSPDASLFIDNCRAHAFLKIRNIQTQFSRPDVTSLIQPCDQDILQAIKLKYQITLVYAIIAAIDAEMPLLEFLSKLN